MNDTRSTAGVARGLSPVIGVVLMVAVTAVLAVVVMFFVMGVDAGTPTSTADVQVQTLVSGEYDVEVQSMGNTDEIRIQCDGAYLSGISITEQTSATIDSSESCDSISVIGVIDEEAQLLRTVSQSE